MKLHTALISGTFVTAVSAADGGAKQRRLRYLKADSKSSKGTKAGKGSYSSSYSMSYGPPTPRPPTDSPVTPPPTERDPTNSPTLVPCCIGFDQLEQTIRDSVYGGGNESFDQGPQRSAMEWLRGDVCNCRDFCTPLELTQRYVLAVLYYSTNGPNWISCSQTAPDCSVQSTYGNSDGTNWLTCNSECEWGGTDCRGDGSLTVTDVENNGLDGILPAEVAALTGLIVFALEQNRLRGPIPGSYGTLSKLGVLDLDFNRLTGPLFDLSQMERLQQLDLNNNTLTGSIEGLGWENTILQFIDLNTNLFTGTIAPEIGDLTTLNTVQFQCNGFLPPIAWTNCPSVNLIANELVCDDSTCTCTESIDPAVNCTNSN